jgi:hypothetical protein
MIRTFFIINTFIIYIEQFPFFLKVIIILNIQFFVVILNILQNIYNSYYLK